MNRNLFIVLLIVVNIAVDQISKVLVRANFEYGEIKSLIGDKFIMQYVENKGAFLGMGSDMNDSLKLIFLLILPVVVLGYVVYYIITNKDLDRTSLIAFSCIAGGGIANVFDRITRGEVTDFFFINLGGVFKTGIFNFADLSVTTGMVLLLLAGLFNNRKKKSNEASMPS
ncbi:signal peptidase II [Winogradskyella aurantia]|uniref:Lipoprotein signal peptidase n=1 Tax=Winogradskyella aurantia TaxID=1915063 RepID=A0A265UPK0_9FLAO|nr:signal peptidase II [Winogradskyella aurantia]OZV67264.1 signal peptidase II [Winogradskyella aurantia]